MPTVRAFGPRRVSIAQLPNVRARNAPGPEVFGAALVPALGNLGRALTEMDERQTRRADQVNILRAENELSAWEAKALYDPTDGALTVKGLNSLGVRDEVLAEFETIADRITSTLATDAQRFAIGKVRNTRRTSIRLNLMRHEFNQIQAVDIEETGKAITNAAEAARRNAMDSKRIQLELDRGIDIIRTFAVENGVGPETMDARIADFQSTVHTGVINRLVDLGRDRQARIYFLQAGPEGADEIASKELGRLTAALEESTLRGESQAVADTILAQSDTPEARRDRVRQIEDPELRDAVDTRVERQIGQDRDSEAAADQAQLEAAYRALDAQPALGMNAIPPSLISQITGPPRAALERYATRNTDGTLETDRQLYADLVRLSALDPAAFADFKLMEVSDRLEKADFQRLLGVQAAILGKVADPAKALDGDQTTTQIATTMIGERGWDVSAKGDDRQRANQFRRLFDEAIGRERRKPERAGKELSNDEIRALGNAIMYAPVSIPGSFAGVFFQGRPGDVDTTILELVFADIPAADVADIRERQVAKGKATDKAAVLKVYQETLLAKRPGAR